MRKLHPRCGIVFAVLVWLAACASTTPAPKPTIDLPEPNPLSANPTLNDAAAVSALVPLEGGSLTATGGDGTTYRLTVPADALLAATTITMTPLTSLVGAPVTGNLHGVALEPAGLRLYQAATLEIEPASGDTVSAIGFAAHSDGSEFHLAPPALGGGSNTVELELLHFSLHGAFQGTEADPYTIEGSPDDFTPTDWEAQQEQLLSDLLAKERTAALEGREGDPEVASKIEAILNTIFKQAIEPLLPGIASSCANFESHGPKVLGWTRNIQLLGFGDTFEAEGRVMAAVVAGAHSCWEEAIQPCIDPEAASYLRVLQTARLNLLLGGSGDVYNPGREDLQCTNECPWVDDLIAIDLEFSFDLQMNGPILGDSGSTGSVSRKWTASVRLPREWNAPNADLVARFGAYLEDGDELGITYEVESTSIASDGEVRNRTQASGTEPTGASSLVVGIALSSCTVGGTFTLYAPDVQTQRFNPDETVVADLLVSWASLGIGQPLTPGVTRGTDTAEGNNSDPGSAFFKAGIDPTLSAFRNRGQWGTAQLEWTMTMITEP